MRIVLAGPKGVGKSTVGARLAERFGLPFVETDLAVEDDARRETGLVRSCRELMRAEGEAAFRLRERAAVERVLALDGPAVVAVGGQTLLDPDSRRRARSVGVLVWLDAPADLLWARVRAGGVPAYLVCDDPAAEYAARLDRLRAVVRPFADVVVEAGAESPDAWAGRVADAVAAELAVRMRAANTAGERVRLTTFGESHGPAVGAVLDGLPPGLPLGAEFVQRALDRRRPGQSAVATPRSEPDRVRILSGVFEGRTTGAPVAFLVENAAARSSDYDTLRDILRPGHADFGFLARFGRRDHRGGGRSSGRETAARVAGGAAAQALLAERGVTVRAWAAEIAGVAARAFDPDEIERNPVRCPDAGAAAAMAAAILAARDDGDSVGGVVELEIAGVPAGWGDPVFGKLDARLAGALMSLGGVKGVEVGDGFAAARARGSENNDAMRPGTPGAPGVDGGRAAVSPRFPSNHAGGILGGISTGQPIRLRLAVKPTPSIRKTQASVDARGAAIDLSVGGRHDPCIVPRLVPVVEATAALVVLDAALAAGAFSP